MAYDKKEFEMLYLGVPVVHDEIACAALAAYDGVCNAFPVKLVAARYSEIMQHVAGEYGVTTEDMREHWKCIHMYTKGGGDERWKR